MHRPALHVRRFRSGRIKFKQDILREDYPVGFENVKGSSAPEQSHLRLEVPVTTESRYFQLPQALSLLLEMPIFRLLSCLSRFKDQPAQFPGIGRQAGEIVAAELFGLAGHCAG